MKFESDIVNNVRLNTTLDVLMNSKFEIVSH